MTRHPAQETLERLTAQGPVLTGGVSWPEPETTAAPGTGPRNVFIPTPLSTVPVWDRELEAINQILPIISAFDAEERARIVGYLTVRFGASF